MLVPQRRFDGFLIARRPVTLSMAFLAIHAISGAGAMAQGKRTGCEVVVYWDGGFDGEAWRTNDDQKDVGPHWNDRISSIVVVSGIWEFYRDQQYKGEVMTLPPGGYPSVGGHWNDQISSFRCVRPTG
jgi:hypothetical protein